MERTVKKTRQEGSPRPSGVKAKAKLRTGGLRRGRSEKSWKMLEAWPLGCQISGPARPTQSLQEGLRWRPGSHRRPSSVKYILWVAAARLTRAIAPRALLLPVWASQAG